MNHTRSPDPLEMKTPRGALNLWKWCARAPQLQILALHGFGGSGLDFALCADRGSKAHDWVAMDQRGHGQSSGVGGQPHFSMPLFVDDCLTFIDHMTAAHSVLLGYSMGGRVALRAALQRHRAIRGLVLVSTSPGIEDLGERSRRRVWDEGMAAKAIALGSACFERDWQQLPMIETQGIMPEPYLTEMRHRRASMAPTALAQTLREVGSGSVPDVWRDLARVTCPTLLVVGANDHTYLQQAERMSRLFPHATMNVIDGAGHAPHLEQPARFHDVLERFLEGLVGAIET